MGINKYLINTGQWLFVVVCTDYDDVEVSVDIMTLYSWRTILISLFNAGIVMVRTMMNNFDQDDLMLDLSTDYSADDIIDHINVNELIYSNNFSAWTGRLLAWVLRHTM